MTDEEWFARVSGDADTENSEPLFPLPDPQIQVSTVGKCGNAALRDAFMFWQFCRQTLLTHGNGLNVDTRVLDFGCAWGRIIRFWLRDLPASNLTGVDVEQRFLSIAMRDVPGPRFMLSRPRPPLDLPGNSIDLIYAMSVFSHLPADVADAWIAEFARILKPGGIACLTTRPRAHIEHAGSDADRTAHAGEYAGIFADRESALAAYDAGRFIYYPSGGGGGLAGETYGEAVIPPAYAREHWKELELVDFAQGYSATYLQPCFVLRRR